MVKQCQQSKLCIHNKRTLNPKFGKPRLLERLKGIKTTSKEKTNRKKTQKMFSLIISIIVFCWNNQQSAINHKYKKHTGRMPTVP